MQGGDKEYLKVSACAKHFAVHSGPEQDRHHQNADPTKRELFDTYLPAFESAVKEAKVESVMSAYNSLYGEPCTCSRYLLQDILRKKWNFRGHVVSDCGAVADICFTHRKTISPIKAAVLAVNNGCDLECGVLYTLLAPAYKMGMVDKATIDTSVRRLLTTRARLGMFDNGCPYDRIGPEMISCKEHTDYAVEVARKSIVLLKNDGVLPLKAETKIAVIGPNADCERMLLANYEGTPDSFITVLNGIKANCPNGNTVYAKGCNITGGKDDGELLDEAIAAAEKSDTVILCMGLDSTLEGEEGDADSYDESGNKYRGDRSTLALPNSQIKLIKAMIDTGKPVIMLNFSGGACTFGCLETKMNALLQCWYPGAKGGRAVGDILYGKTNPSGRLPVTFYLSDKNLMDFSDYCMDNRTYRYFNGEVMYPFGYGLSYSTFCYSNLRCEWHGKNIDVQFTVENNGPYDGDEIAQLYIKHLGISIKTPIFSLRKIARLTLKNGENQNVNLRLDEDDLSYIDDDGEKTYNQHVEISVGGVSPDRRFFNGLSQIIKCEK